jgi:PAS domain S-box-containing protein
MRFDRSAEGALLAALLDGSHECIKLLDADGRIVFVNREGCRTMELSAPDDVVGQSWVARWPVEAQSDVSDALEQARRGEAARFSGTRPGANGETKWWDVTLTPVAAGGDAKFIAIARDMTAEVAERERAAAIGAEMRHRLRNGMTIAAGLVTLEARSQPEHRDFAQTVAGRFAQLGHVQELVLDADREKTLRTVLPLLAGVYGGGELLRIHELPDVRLSDSATQGLALALGELATNSLKYGALRNGEPIEISADVADGRLSLHWREPTHFGQARPGGQGLGLIERILASAGGTIARDISGDQLQVRIELPVLTS